MDDSATNPVRKGWRHVVFMLSMRPFGPYLGGHFLASLAVWISRIAAGWLTWQLTESAAWLGAIAFARLGPALAGAPLGGVFADRHARAIILAVSRGLSSVLNIALFGLMLADLIQIEVLFLIVAADGFLDAFGNASSKAIVYDLVPREAIASGISLNSLAFHLASLVGPVAAGAIIAAFGTPYAFIAAAMFLAIFVVYVLIMGGHLAASEAKKQKGPRGSIRGDLAAAVRYALGHPTIAPLLWLQFGFALTVRPLIELLPGFAAAVMQGDATTLAILQGSIGAMAILGGLWMASRGTSRGLTGITLIAGTVISLSMLAFVATDNLLVAVPALGVFGFCRIIRVSGTQALVQISVTEGQRGRVISLFGLIIRLGGATGAFLIGLLADAIGLRIAVGLAAVVAFCVVLTVLPKRKRIVAGIGRDTDLL